MALVVEDGSGLANAESYISVANADTYFSASRGAASTYAEDWAAASTTTAIKEALLRWATRLLDKHWSYAGTKSTTTQKLRWPREGVYDVEGDELPSDELPDDLVHATAEMARALLVDPARVEDQETGLASGSVGPLNAVFDRYDRAGVLPLPVKSLLLSLGTLRTAAGRGREIVRG